MPMTIREYAEKRRICVQPIYRKIKRHENELKGHVKKIRGRLELDDEAVIILDGKYSGEINNETNPDWKIRELEEEIVFLKKELGKKDKEIKKARDMRHFYQVSGEKTKKELIENIEKLTLENKNLKNELEKSNRSFLNRIGGTRT